MECHTSCAPSQDTPHLSTRSAAKNGDATGPHGLRVQSWPQKISIQMQQRQPGQFSARPSSTGDGGFGTDPHEDDGCTCRSCKLLQHDQAMEPCLSSLQSKETLSQVVVQWVWSAAHTPPCEWSMASMLNIGASVATIRSRTLSQRIGGHMSTMTSSANIIHSPDGRLTLYGKPSWPREVHGLPSPSVRSFISCGVTPTCTPMRHHWILVPIAPKPWADYQTLQRLVSRVQHFDNWAPAAVDFLPLSTDLSPCDRLPSLGAMPHGGRKTISSR